MRTEKEQYDAEIEDMRLVAQIKKEVGYNRTLAHIGFLMQELGLWKGHSFDFGNYPTALQSDGFTQMVYESDMNPHIGVIDRLDLQTVPLLKEIESLVKSRQYWYDIFAYLLFCNKYGYPTKKQSKEKQIAAVKQKYKHALDKDISLAWNILEEHNLILAPSRQLENSVNTERSKRL